MDLWIRLEDNDCNSIHKVSEIGADFTRESGIALYPIFGKIGEKEILLGEYDKERCNSIIEEIHKRLLYSEKDIVIFTMPTINYKGESENEE